MKPAALARRALFALKPFLGIGANDRLSELVPERKLTNLARNTLAKYGDPNALGALVYALDGVLVVAVHRLTVDKLPVGEAIALATLPDILGDLTLGDALDKLSPAIENADE